MGQNSFWNMLPSVAYLEPEIQALASYFMGFSYFVEREEYHDKR